jgi:hypothetical protein
VRDHQERSKPAQNAGLLGWRGLVRRIWYFVSNLLSRKGP